MYKRWLGVFVGLCAFMLAGPWASPSNAQQKMEMKEKPPMYSYVVNWDVARGDWKVMEKEQAGDAARMQKFFDNGTIVAFGADVNLVHQENEPTHDDWWSAMSMAGLLNVLAAEKASGAAEAPVYAASKHHDGIYVSRYYNWKSGSFTNGYTRVAVFKLKADAPDDAVEQVSKNMIAPVMEKLLADGAIYEYEIDTQAVHTEDPGLFFIIFIANGPEGLDKYSAALRAAHEANPLAGAAFDSWVDYSAHRDELAWTTATYK